MSDQWSFPQFDDEPFESDPAERKANAASLRRSSTADRSVAVPAKRTGPSLKARAIDLLSRREHSRVELQRKLIRHADSAEQLEQLLDDLEQEKWLSDERFAHSLLNRRAHKHGSRRIIQELKQNGISAQHIATLEASLRDTEFDRAYDVWERKFNQLPADDKAYAKQYRFLVSRGFSPSVFQQILSHVKSHTLD